MPHLTTDDGVKLYYEDTGTGTPIVFVHEFAGDHRSWEPQVRYFSRNYRCITYSAVNQSNSRLYTKMMLTGFRDHFISIHIDWSQARQQTASDADAALQAFVPALLH